MSATTAGRARGKQTKQNPKRRRARTGASRTLPSSNNGSDVVTTGNKNKHNNNSNEVNGQKMYHKQNQVYDGTGRLYECMSVAELNIRLRNLADHCLATHKGNLEQREKLMYEIKDIQKTVDQLLGELKDQVMKQIQDNARDKGNLEERIVQLTKEKENVELELEHERKKNQTGSQMNDDLQKGIDDQINAVRKEGLKKAQRLQNDLNRSRGEADELRKQLRVAQGTISDKDAAGQKMSREISDLKSKNKDLKGQVDSLESQLRAKGRQSLSFSNDPTLQGEIEDLKKRNNDLTKQLARARNEAKTKEATIADLDATHKAFEDKLGKQLKDNFEAFLEKASEARDAQRDTEELKKYYKEQLDRMHELWEQASREIRQVFDKNYKDLKDRLENAYNEARMRCNELEELNKHLNKRVNDLNNEKLLQSQQLQDADKTASKQDNTIKKLRIKVDKLNSELVDLQVKISQYRVIWNHYMMLEGKLKNEIGHLDNSVAAFEDEMQVEPPMPKRRRVAIGAIREYSNGLHLPLELSEVPIPETLFHRHYFRLRNQNSNKSKNSIGAEAKEADKEDIDNNRFLLVNNARSTHFTLLGQWHLINDRGDRVPLPRDLSLAPGGSLGICMGNERAIPNDLLLKNYKTQDNKPFITFALATDRLYLEDSTGGQMELFSPSLPDNNNNNNNNDIKDDVEDFDVNNDTQGGTIEHANRLKHYLDIQELLRIAEKPYFILVNVSNNPIILKGFKLKRERGKFEMPFPEMELVAGHPLRFLFADQKEYPSDVLIHPRTFGSVKNQDKLILEDAFGGRHHLLSNLGSPQRLDRSPQVEEDKCFVM